MDTQPASMTIYGNAAVKRKSNSLGLYLSFLTCPTLPSWPFLHDSTVLFLFAPVSPSQCVKTGSSKHPEKENPNLKGFAIFQFCGNFSLSIFQLFWNIFCHFWTFGSIFLQFFNFSEFFFCHVELFLILFATFQLFSVQMLMHLLTAVPSSGAFQTGKCLPLNSFAIWREC